MLKIKIGSDLSDKINPFKVKIKKQPTFKGQIQGNGFAKTKDETWDYHNLKGTCNWYADKIGEIIEVLPFNSKFYRVNNPFGCGFFFIHKSDCEIVS